jgi:hypothetical protein
MVRIRVRALQRVAEACLGDVHKRQRRVMLPAFGTGESRAFVSIFSQYAAQVRHFELIVSVSNESYNIDGQYVGSIVRQFCH